MHQVLLQAARVIALAARVAVQYYFASDNVTMYHDDNIHLTLISHTVLVCLPAHGHPYMALILAIGVGHHRVATGWPPRGHAVATRWPRGGGRLLLFNRMAAPNLPLTALLRV